MKKKRKTPSVNNVPHKSLYDVARSNKSVFSLQKEKSCDNIPKEPVVFEKMKLVGTSVNIEFYLSNILFLFILLQNCSKQLGFSFISNEKGIPLQIRVAKKICAKLFLNLY